MEVIVRNNKVNIFKATAAFLVILAAVFYYYEEIKVPVINIETSDVIVAISDIPANTVIEKEMLTIEKRYTEDVIKIGNIATQLNYVEGKRTIAPIYKGEPININRIIENKKYMNSQDQTQISFAISEVDKALDLKEGDYIDIWLEPISRSQDNQDIFIPHKLIEKIQIIKAYDSNYNSVNQQKAASGTDSIISSNSYVPAYLTIELSDKVLKELFAIDKSKYNVRVTRYGEEKTYNTIANIMRGD